MDSHLHTYVNSSFRTPQRALCDPKKTINWHLHDVEWRTLAKGLLLQLHQCCGTIYLLTSNDPRPWTFSSLILRLICFNLHILRDCLNVCVNVWLCYYFMLCTLGQVDFPFALMPRVYSLQRLWARVKYPYVIFVTSWNQCFINTTLYIYIVLIDLISWLVASVSDWLKHLGVPYYP